MFITARNTGVQTVVMNGNSFNMSRMIVSWIPRTYSSVYYRWPCERATKAVSFQSFRTRSLPASLLLSS